MEKRVTKLEEAIVSIQNDVSKLSKLTHAERVIRQRLDALGALLAIVSITILETAAIYKGEDGAMLLPVVAIVAALAGVKATDIIGAFGKKK